MSRSFNSSRHVSIQGESRDVYLDYLLVFPALDNHVIIEINNIIDAPSNRRIFVNTFCLINICLSLSDDANKMKTLNIERA